MLVLGLVVKLLSCLPTEPIEIKVERPLVFTSYCLWLKTCFTAPYSHSSHTHYTVHKCSHLIKGKCAYTVRRQFHGVQHGHLYHPIGLCASTRPVLVTLHLHRETQQSVFFTNNRVVVGAIGKRKRPRGEKDYSECFHCLVERCFAAWWCKLVFSLCFTYCNVYSLVCSFVYRAVYINLVSV